MKKNEISISGLLSLGAVYLIWGSTFLAMRITVREGSGFEPFSVGASRLIVSSFILIAFSYFSGRNLSITMREGTVLAISGLGIWLGGNGLTLWAEQFVESSYAVMILGLIPIWTAILQSVYEKRFPSRIIFLAIGCATTGLLLTVRGAVDLKSSELLMPTLLIVLGSLTWAFGTVIQKWVPTRKGFIVSSAYQQLFGAIGFTFVAFLSGEPFPTPRGDALWAWGYLVIFGSLIAYSAYLAAIQIYSAKVASTFAYICPIVGIILGWLILSEPITIYKVAGIGLIIMGAYGVFYDQQKGKDIHVK